MVAITRRRFNNKNKRLNKTRRIRKHSITKRKTHRIKKRKYYGGGPEEDEEEDKDYERFDYLLQKLCAIKEYKSTINEIYYETGIKPLMKEWNREWNEKGIKIEKGKGFIEIIEKYKNKINSNVVYLSHFEKRKKFFKQYEIDNTILANVYDVLMNFKYKWIGKFDLVKNIYDEKIDIREINKIRDEYLIRMKKLNEKLLEINESEINEKSYNEKIKPIIYGTHGGDRHEMGLYDIIEILNMFFSYKQLENIEISDPKEILDRYISFNEMKHYDNSLMDSYEKLKLYIDTSLNFFKEETGTSFTNVSADEGADEGGGGTQSRRKNIRKKRRRTYKK